jgi:hypothetical protein
MDLNQRFSVLHTSNCSIKAGCRFADKTQGKVGQLMSNHSKILFLITCMFGYERSYEIRIPATRQSKHAIKANPILPELKPPDRLLTYRREFP